MEEMSLSQRIAARAIAAPGRHLGRPIALPFLAFETTCNGQSTMVGLFCRFIKRCVMKAQFRSVIRRSGGM